jgi:SAM-dependent methyltransferase
MPFPKPPRRVGPKSLSQISAEWDRIAEIRWRQLLSGEDLSFDNVLAPAVLDFVEGLRPQSILDVGCGTGVLTEMLASRAARVVGIDPSVRSIEICQAEPSAKADYLVSSVEAFSIDQTETFEAVVAHMVMMDLPDLPAALAACARLCESGGWLHLTITHPWFWPYYWGYADAEWFAYDREVFIEAEFRTSRLHAGLVTTHIHRPLEAYVRAAVDSGFQVADLLEPMPPAEIEQRYPLPWQYPRFLVLACRRR